MQGEVAGNVAAEMGEARRMTTMMTTVKAVDVTFGNFNFILGVEGFL